jgi:hypothetical protein
MVDRTRARLIGVSDGRSSGVGLLAPAGSEIGSQHYVDAGAGPSPPDDLGVSLQFPDDSGAPLPTSTTLGASS